MSPQSNLWISQHAVDRFESRVTSGVYVRAILAEAVWAGLASGQLVEYTAGASAMPFEYEGDNYYAICMPAEGDAAHPKRLAVVTVVSAAFYRHSMDAYEYARASRGRPTLAPPRPARDVAAHVERRARQMGGVREAKLLELAAKIRGHRG